MLCRSIRPAISALGRGRVRTRIFPRAGATLHTMFRRKGVVWFALVQHGGNHAHAHCLGRRASRHCGSGDAAFVFRPCVSLHSILALAWTSGRCGRRRTCLVASRGRLACARLGLACAWLGLASLGVASVGLASPCLWGLRSARPPLLDWPLGLSSLQLVTSGRSRAGWSAASMFSAPAAFARASRSCQRPTCRRLFRSPLREAASRG